MATPTDVDRSAPVLAQHDVDILAPLETVWQRHVDVNAWPTWQTDITTAHMDGAFEPGNSFDWSSYGFAVTSTIYVVADRSRVLWGGTAGGITGIHGWLFAETPGGVRVTTNESFSGEPVGADPASMQSILDTSLSSWLAHLKTSAEVGLVADSLD
jgi:Polyketide cyclase / dehydrase and lipid transport